MYKIIDVATNFVLKYMVIIYHEREYTNMKKLVLKTLAFISIFAAVSATVAYADFSDMPEDQIARTALETAVENKLLTGYETGEIKPYNNIKRAEMAAIIVRAFGAESNADISNFADMNQSQWYYDVMSKSVAMGVFQGDGTNLNPESNITYQEAFAVLARVFDMQTNYDVELLKYRLNLISERPTEKFTVLNNFADGTAVAEWAKPTTTAILEGGYWNPADSMIRPTEPITRVNFALLMNNIVTTYINEPGTYDSLPQGNVLVRSNNVVINSFDCSTANIFVGDGVKGVTTLGDGVNVDKLVVRGGNTSLNGTYNLVRIIGHNCITDISKGPTVKIQLYSKYDDSVFSVGVAGV